jgi:hypothetical protein
MRECLSIHLGKFYESAQSRLRVSQQLPLFSRLFLIFLAIFNVKGVVEEDKIVAIMKVFAISLILLRY